jgi:tetratricopeptide (TPR) repeat protein
LFIGDVKAPRRDDIQGALRAGRFADAERLAVARRARHPEDSGLAVLYVRALLGLGRGCEASGVALGAVKREPGSAELWLVLGDSLVDLGRFGEALLAYEQAIAADASCVEASVQRARVFAAAGRVAEALADLARALAKAPQHQGALRLQGALFAREGRGAESLACFEALVAAPSPHPDDLVNLARLYVPPARWEEGERLCARAAVIDPKHLEAYRLRGRLLVELRRYDQARACFEAVLARRPDDVDALGALARVHERQGRPEEAHALLAPLGERLGQDTHLASCWGAVCLERRAPREGVPVLREAIARATSDAERAHLGYTLGHLLDAAGAWDEAFTEYADANARRRLTWDVRAHDAYVRDIAGVWDEARLARPRPRRPGSERLVFVVGMPRSGTSLTETILARYPGVHAAGERLDVLRFATSLHARPKGFRAAADALAPTELSVMASSYLAETERIAPGARLVVDKLPQNFLHLGLIAELFPGARVIHCVRDAIDTCLSCHFQAFYDAHAWSTSLGALGRYYAAYERLFAHWDRVRPLPVLTLGYESLVREPEPSIRRLLAFLELPWDEACLTPERAAAGCHTSSYAQVRRPIHEKSVRRSVRYAKHLGPLYEALGRAAAEATLGAAPPV